MNSYRNKGALVPHTASSDLSSGDVVVCGVEIRVCVTDIANGAVGSVRRAGRVTLDAASADSWSAGDQLYWNAGTQCLTSTASGGNTKAGIAVSDKAALTTTADVILNGSAG